MERNGFLLCIHITELRGFAKHTATVALLGPGEWRTLRFLKGAGVGAAWRDVAPRERILGAVQAKLR